MADFSIVKKGYDPDEVNAYIAKLEDVIKSYKEKDMAIKNAIISAQVAADNIVKNAELEAMSRKYKTMEILNSLQSDIVRQKETLVSFKQDYNEIMKKYLKDFNEVEYQLLVDKLHLLENNLTSSTNKLSGKPVAEEVEQPTKPIEKLSDENLL